MKNFLKMAVIGAAIAMVLAVMPAAAQTPTSTDMWTGVDSLLDGYDAVKTQSTEARYSAGRFTSYVDDFIGVNDYDLTTGTFLFLGGYKAVAGSGVDTTDGLTGPAPLSAGSGADPYAVSFGFAKGFETFYLAGYYAGHGIWGSGENDGGDPETIEANGKWKNNLALLFGNSGIGAIRFDIIIDGQVDSRTVDGDVPNGGNGTDSLAGGAGGPPILTTVLRWGKNIGTLSPHATLGFKWPGYEQVGDGDGKQYTDWKNAGLLFNGGTGISLQEKALISLDLDVAADFGENRTGDLPNDKETSKQGDLYLGLNAGYENEIAFSDKFALGFKAPVTVGLLIDGHDEVTAGVKTDTWDDVYFGLKFGVDVGLQFKATQKIALYTGFGLTLFDWTVLGKSSGPSDNKAGDWNIDGIQWDPSKGNSATNSIGVGMTIAPVEGLSIGFGLNVILDQLILIDATKMTVALGPFWGSFNPFNGTSDIFGGLFSSTSFDLTVSYKF
ncbi:hypothetical protein FACS1894147_12190 [Spirochaetia bacterium]|nr:hypothetical protein FACS1894147_12190 [Spirochaetia bacterium]